MSDKSRMQRALVVKSPDPALWAPLRDQFQRPLRDLRISVIDTCNFRCTYCMPGDREYKFMDSKDRISFDEIVRLVEHFVPLGVKKIRITGGEPLLRKGIEDLISRLASIHGIEDLSLTTNGYLLKSKAQALKDAGLQRITVSLDTIDEKIFQEMSGTNVGLQTVLDGIDEAARVGLKPIKINAVVQKRVNCHRVEDLAGYFKERGHILRFIEFMDVGNQNNWSMEHVVPSKHLMEKIHKVYPLEPVDANYFGETATRYRYLDGSGEVGFISSVTQAFCSSCTRARLSPKGMLYTCLFASKGMDLLSPMREGCNDDELRKLIFSNWEGRLDRYSEERAANKEQERSEKIEMFYIGG